jgi:hypothetical protein
MKYGKGSLISVTDQIMFTRVVGSSIQLEHVIYSLEVVPMVELTNGAGDVWIYDEI